MFHCNSDHKSKLLMILNNAPAACCNFEVKQAFSLDFGQHRETSTSFSHGIASIGFVRGCLKCEFPIGLGFVGSVERTPPLSKPSIFSEAILMSCSEFLT